MMSGIETHLLEDDGLIPNNGRLPLILYRQVFAPAQTSPTADIEAEIIARFGRHQWGAAWVDGIYDFHHYHARAHEVLAIADGSVDVQFGGPTGPVLKLEAGDGVVIPAGVGHCRKESLGRLSVVGAYPAGQYEWDLKKATSGDRTQALGEIPRVPVPRQDPFFGRDGTLFDHWR